MSHASFIAKPIYKSQLQEHFITSEVDKSLTLKDLFFLGEKLGWFISNLWCGP